MRLIIVFLGLLLGSLTAVGADPSIRPALTLDGSWAVQTAVHDPIQGISWRTDASGDFQGGSFIQFRAYPLLQVKGCVDRKDTSGVCKRLRIRAKKPSDKIGSFAIQFPGRTKRVTAAVGVPYAEIMLDEISLEDFGVMAFQLVVEGAETQSFGAANLRTHDQEIIPAALVALTVDGQVLKEGDSVEKGWWFLFFGTAKTIDVIEDPADLLSLCAFPPNGKPKCVSGNRMELRIKERGDYLFVAWNKFLQSSWVTIRGV
jgi:hypothetical protein